MILQCIVSSNVGNALDPSSLKGDTEMFAFNAFGSDVFGFLVEVFDGGFRILCRIVESSDFLYFRFVVLKQLLKGGVFINYFDVNVLNIFIYLLLLVLFGQ